MKRVPSYQPGGPFTFNCERGTEADLVQAENAALLPAVAIDAVEALVRATIASEIRRPVVIGLCGAQGSGKSTIAAESDADHRNPACCIRVTSPKNLIGVFINMMKPVALAGAFPAYWSRTVQISGVING